MAKAKGVREPTIKASVATVAQGGTTNLQQLAALTSKPGTIEGVLDPPYDPVKLVQLNEQSGVLPQHIEAIITNVDSYGHKLVASIDLKSATVKEQLREALTAERYEAADLTNEDLGEPSEEEVDAAFDRFKRQSAVEKNRAQAFFSSCCPDYSFIELRRRMRLDQFITGNAYIEVLRDERGRPSRMVLAPAVNMRILPRDDRPTLVDEWTRVSEVSWTKVKQERYFRRFAEIDHQNKKIKVYFKQYGDPRVVSRLSGKTYADMTEFTKDKDRSPGDAPASEILHIGLPNAGSPYGVPSWIGNLPAVLGSRELDEVNLAYFENKTVPPLALLVNGGRLAKGVVPRIEDFVEQQVKGKKNFHKILIIEAEGQKSTAGTSGIIPTIKFESLRSAQQQDALFQEYDERNWDKVASSFRLPRILVGRDRAINRACYDDQTEVLTTRGWVLHADVIEEDVVAQFDPPTGRVVWARPKHLYAAPYTGDMIHFRNTHTDVVVTPDHKMTYTYPQNDKWDVSKAESIAFKRFCFPVAAREYEGKPAPATFTLPRVEGCNCSKDKEHQPIAWADWMEFVGLAVSDGGILNTACNERPLYWTMLRAKKMRGVDRIRAIAKKLGWHASEVTKKDGTVVLTFSHKCLHNWMKENTGGYAKTRYLPEDYLLYDRDTLTRLYGALASGDGTTDPRPGRTSRTYYSASPKLAEQVQQLIFLLGMRASIRPGERCERVQFSAHDRAELRAEHDVKRVPYDGMVYCLVTDTGFYVTRRNGKIACQGNTALAAIRFAEEQVFEPIRNTFDDTINRQILPPLGVFFWRFRSNTPVTRDPEMLAEIIATLVEAGVLTPAEGRKFTSDVFNEELTVLDDAWANKPLKLTLAELKAKETTQLSEDVDQETGLDRKRRRLEEEANEASDQVLAEEEEDADEAASRTTKSRRKSRGKRLA